MEWEGNASLTTNLSLAVVGAGFAGVAAALAARSADETAKITLFERNAQPLAWVERLGDRPLFLGWASDEPDTFLNAMRESAEPFASLFMRVPGSGARDWWEAQGIPTTSLGSSLVSAIPAREVAKSLRRRLSDLEIGFAPRHTTEEASFSSDGSARLWFSEHSGAEAARLLLAVGGGPNRALSIVRDAGHADELFSPGCFAFRVVEARLKGLQGLEIQHAGVTVLVGHPPRPVGQGEGALRVTGRGLEGPAVLDASAGAAAELTARDYTFTCSVNWIALHTGSEVSRNLQQRGLAFGNRSVHTDPLFNLPPKLWQRLAKSARIAPDITWTSCPGRKLNALAGQLTQGKYAVKGHFLDTHERTWRGGVAFDGFDPATLESHHRPHLFAAGEMLAYLGNPGAAHAHATLATALVAGSAATGKSVSDPVGGFT